MLDLPAEACSRVQACDAYRTVVYGSRSLHPQKIDKDVGRLKCSTLAQSGQCPRHEDDLEARARDNARTVPQSGQSHRS